MSSKFIFLKIYKKKTILLIFQNDSLVNDKTYKL